MRFPKPKISLPSPFEKSEEPATLLSSCFARQLNGLRKILKMRMRKLCFCCCEPAKHAEKNEETGLGLLSEFTDDKSLQDEGIEMYARRIEQQPQQITSNDQSRVALPQEELDGVEMLANATEQLPKHQASDGPFRITVESSNEDIVKESLYMRFLRSENGDQTKAVDRLKKTIAWRAEVGASTALSSAQPNFWIIKSFVPHVLHGRDRSGRPVIYSKPSGMQLKILKSHGLSLDDFVKHCKSTSATSCWLLFAFVDF